MTDIDHKTPVFEGEIHPVADLFPMLSGDELHDLAIDIKKRGLLQPIVLDSEGRLLDGRNRLAACQQAGIRPTFVTYEGEDPDGYALSVNITRRHLTTGARAVVAEQARRLNGVGKSAQARDSDIERKRLTEAGLVLDHTPDLAVAVVAGTYPLSRAVEDAREAKRRTEALETDMARLRAEAPDLATLVEEERMSVPDAIAVLKARVTKADAEAAQDEADRLASINRDQRRLEGFVNGWPNLIGLANHPYRDEILNGLTDHDQRIILEAEAIYQKGTQP